jgi:hypothetical protein
MKESGSILPLEHPHTKWAISCAHFEPAYHMICQGSNGTIRMDGASNFVISIVVHVVRIGPREKDLVVNVTDKGGVDRKVVCKADKTLSFLQTM